LSASALNPTFAIFLNQEPSMARKRKTSTAASTPREQARIRLACSNCDRSDRDGITETELEACRAEGWTEIEFTQTYEQAVITYENPADAPAGHDATAWYTHLGLCPDCRAETEGCK
jgi:hypothetical protein